MGMVTTILMYATYETTLMEIEKYKDLGPREWTLHTKCKLT